MPTEDYEDLAIGIANLMKFGQVKKLWADFYKRNWTLEYRYFT